MSFQTPPSANNQGLVYLNALKVASAQAHAVIRIVGAVDLPRPELDDAPRNMPATPRTVSGTPNRMVLAPPLGDRPVIKYYVTVPSTPLVTRQHPDRNIDR